MSKKVKIASGIKYGFAQIEREYLLKALREVKPSTEQEKRILKRFAMRMIGTEHIHKVPLYADAECPICEKTLKENLLPRHLDDCKRKQKEQKTKSYVDPDVLEMLGL